MFLVKRSFVKTLSTSLANFSSKTNKFDPRSPELSQLLQPWDRGQTKAKKKTFLKFFDQGLRPTDLLKILQTPIDLRASKLKSWWQKKLLDRNLEIQEYDGLRNASLGSDISIGHALLPLGVGLLYKGKPWMKAEVGSWNIPEVPDTREDDWILEAVDFSGTPICYEGLLNFKNLSSVHTIKAQNCPHLDDWCIDILCSEVLTLEQLDVSGCKNISPKGLIPLTRLPNLQRIDLTDCPAFETHDGVLMCILLQEFNPNLKIDGVVYPEIPDMQSSVTKA
ncbi:distal membrane-arm assembly complex protein 2 [Thrips palmi]|uniref:Distal membrane-arm assembly complex protein 2 n=1 Tax=Thrips palmi TaxID=161013 RepID=A0A6P9A5H1_THRPL|nr:distal membrane-arm assembly complex protein 2 [Thrips palmi]